MYSTLLVLHSIFRWLVLFALIFSVYKAFKGYYANSPFSAIDNKIRHWTATIAHVQLIIGMLLYAESPIVKYFFSNFTVSLETIDLSFFGLYHFLLMLAAIIVLTIGSAKAKRKATDKEKYRTMLIWFSLALLIIFISIPWPFSPIVNRPYIRIF
ncbi:hypothetical protein FNH22_06295 [Fulvivirga sp. M361]|uniref:hypothetical protein n=1 Tax=Fulvivirga sp. M361 TaxID=2594266 RepID=UPI00117B419F|nr:hypothetical protein [Fulvivirga sp. M361]TRX60651.1 hypothetical protein FNH22_06295 [Fulvivirga sp. M361]